ncbi:MAG TPA: Spy/CpxP family protein refolding chaperone [Polyangia bacterium]|nr:Spy/CpxP family protein refolding chaperone [Polyangia bacterium]
MDTTSDLDSGTTLPQGGRRARRLSRRSVASIAGLAVVGALSFSVAQARGFGGGPDGFMAFRMHKILDKVGATDAQKAQIKTIWEGLRPQLKTLHQQHAGLRQQITQAMTAPTIDAAAIEKLRQQSVAVMDKVSSVMTQGFVETARVLTPEQRKQAAAEIQKARENRRAHFEENGPSMGEP